MSYLIFIVDLLARTRYRYLLSWTVESYEISCVVIGLMLMICKGNGLLLGEAGVNVMPRSKASLHYV